MANKGIIKCDPATRTLTVEVVDSATGARVATVASIELDGDSAVFDGLQNKAMKVRLLHFKDASTCEPMKMAVIGTEPETDYQGMSSGTALTSADEPTTQD